MTIEAWDPASRRWVLYESEAQHSKDCDAYPYEKIPKRVFLDTNVVNLLVLNAEQIFEQAPVEDRADKTLSQDIEALMHVFYFGARASWDLIASQKTIEEITATPDALVRQDLLEYALGFLQPRVDDGTSSRDFGRRLSGTHFVSALPDFADQILLGDAIGHGCDAFCTRDRRTIVKHRDKLGQLPIRILTPLEWWQCIKPWAGLLI